MRRIKPCKGETGCIALTGLAPIWHLLSQGLPAGPLQGPFDSLSKCHSRLSPKPRNLLRLLAGLRVYCQDAEAPRRQKDYPLHALGCAPHSRVWAWNNRLLFWGWEKHGIRPNENSDRGLFRKRELSEDGIGCNFGSLTIYEGYAIHAAVRICG